MKPTKHHKLKRKLLNALDLPADADGSAIRITMVANTDLLVENHAGVLRYTDRLVRLYSPHGILRIEGKALQLSEFGPERVYIRGEIAGWQYEDAVGCGNP